MRPESMANSAMAPTSADHSSTDTSMAFGQMGGVTRASHQRMPVNPSSNTSSAAPIAILLNQA
ncbi:hypothetical protein D3C75_1286770 [compost metagenome]